jgi:hypothetical protein
VDVHHPDTQACRGGNGTRDGVRDVMKLQVEKHAIAARGEFLDESGPGAREQAASNLDSAGHTTESFGKRSGIRRTVDVKSD